jgi:hypothetical protein
MTELPLQSVLERVLGALDRTSIPYMIMGGFAVRAWGIPRPTYDVDLTLQTDADALERFLAVAESDGFLVPEEHRKGFQDTLAGMSKIRIQRFEDRTVWDIDLFLVTTDYQRAAFPRRRKVRFLGTERWTMAPEDLILHKLLARRRKDLLDVEEIFQVCTDMDTAYLKSWAGALGVSAALSEFLP